MRRAWTVGLLTLLISASVGHGQYVLRQSPQPLWRYPQRPYPAPLWLKITQPKGMKVTFYPGGSRRPKTLTVPFTVALRPGYIYRVKLSDIPEQPGMTLFPTLEVRRSLRSENRFQAKSHPAVLAFTEDDFRTIRRGGLVTDVVVLEKRDNALPYATDADSPPQLPVADEEDPVQVAEREAVPLVVLRMGQRTLSEQELKAFAIPGTIWLPGDKSLPRPQVPPYIPWADLSLADPILGPRTLGEELCLSDGGDIGLRAGFDGLGRLKGLDPSDTIAEFTDSNGKRRIAVSNRVCICVPRFLIIRGARYPLGKEVYVATNHVERGQGVDATQIRRTVDSQKLSVQTDAVHNRMVLAQVTAQQGTVIVGQYEGVAVRIGLQAVRGVTSACQTLTGEELRDCLVLVKWPDKLDARIGDIVTFTLKYTNKGKRPLRNVVITDSLITRFEYIDGSARTDRAANFTTQPNDHGSKILRWELVDDLPAGESGMVTFQVRIR